MIRLILEAIFLLFFGIFSIIGLPLTWLVGKISKNKQDRFAKKIVAGTFKIILVIAGVKVETVGKENLPQDKACLYVANHNSFFDVLVMYTEIPEVFGFVAKQEIKKVPILRVWMKYVNCLFIDRDNMKQSLKVILEGIDMLKKGTNLCVFPEGTRSKDGNMLPFKEGSMKLATKSGALIVPVAMTGTADVFENHFPFIRSSKVKFIVGEPIDVSELEAEKKKNIGAHTREVIEGLMKVNS